MYVSSEAIPSAMKEKNPKKSMKHALEYKAKNALISLFQSNTIP
jgi:hypothetical protein